MSTVKIEFAVQMTCDNCVNAVKKSVENVKEVKSIDIDLKSSSVVVETSLSAEEALRYLEKSGRKVALRGYGNQAGVAILDTGNSLIKGVVRFVQQSSNSCLIDGTVDGLKPGKHNLTIHECGDISNGCESVGNFFNPNKEKEGRIYGNLGTVNAESNGRAIFRFNDNIIKLSDIIGRSLVLSATNNGEKLACGIIARSAGLFQNAKTICACDGVTIWNEKIPPNSVL